MIRGVVFDFDGVIVDSHPVHKRAWRKFLESVGETASEEELQFVLDGRKREDILRHFLGDLEGAGVAIGIASSGSRSRVSFLLDRLDLKKHFQVIVTGDEVKKGKPDPSVFLKAAQALQEDPRALLAFEDAVSGVESAKAAGMKCVGIAHAGRASLLLDSGADHVVP